MIKRYLERQRTIERRRTLITIGTVIALHIAGCIVEHIYNNQ